MREIKFRGQVPAKDVFDGGKIVYGSLMIYSTGMYTHWIHPLEGERNYPVDPDTVKQLVGHDKNGTEVYEGDEIISVFDGKEYRYKAHVKGFATTADGCYIPEEQFASREVLEVVSNG